MVTLKTRHVSKIRLGIVTQVAKSTLLELRNPLATFAILV
jgi:hypothetical protein